MYPILFEVFGRQISTYGLFLIIGALVAWILVYILKDKDDKDTSLVFLICLCGGLIGAFALRPIMRIPELIKNWELFRQVPLRVFLAGYFGEMVFYGGVIGGAIAVLIYCKGNKIPVLPVVDMFAPALAVAHGFGRIGCFFGGCCYGIEVHGHLPFAVVFPQQSYTAATLHGDPVLATQLIEATGLFIFAAILIIIYKKTAITGLTICIYGFLYSIFRFVIEFYRGDRVRGIYGGLSTSQYISMVVFIFCAILLYIILRRRKGLFCSRQNGN